MYFCERQLKVSRYLRRAIKDRVRRSLVLSTAIRCSALPCLRNCGLLYENTLLPRDDVSSHDNLAIVTKVDDFSLVL